MTGTTETVSDTKASDNNALRWKKLSYGLGVFSLALAAAELLAPKRIAKALSSEGHEGLIRAFGAREAIAGVGLVTDQGHGRPSARAGQQGGVGRDRRGRGRDHARHLHRHRPRPPHGQVAAVRPLNEDHA